MKILGINTDCYEINLPNFDEISIRENISLLDYDSVIINAFNLTDGYDSKERVQNLPVLTQNESVQIQEDYNRIRSEIVELLKLGKRIYVFLGHNPNCAISTGTSRTSGTGRNAEIIVEAHLFDAYSFLPIKIELVDSCGENFSVVSNSPFANLLKKLSDKFYYSVYFKDSIDTPIAKIKNTNKIISAEVDYENGKLILLPSPKMEHQYNEREAWIDASKNIFDCIYSLEEKLNQVTDFILPQWATQFRLPTENENLLALEKSKEEQEKIILKIEEQERKIKDLEEYKQHFTATGTPLENIVRKTLENLGFSFDETEPNRTDLIAKYQERCLLIEIKGLSKSAAEKNCAQLEKWASEYLEKYECQAKPMLIVNAYRETPLLERTEPAFPNQMLGYATKRDHCLITGIQLLCMYLDIKANPAKKEKVIEELFNTVGVYAKYADFENYLVLNDKEKN